MVRMKLITEKALNVSNKCPKRILDTFIAIIIHVNSKIAIIFKTVQIHLSRIIDIKIMAADEF